MASEDAYDCDVLVVGGGPSGSTTATLLQRRGRRVILLEKDRHPRFHIGESLLPCNLPIMEELGVLEKVRALGVGLPYALTVSIFGGTAEYLALWFKHIGHESGFYWYVTGCIAISLAVYVGMRDTKRHSRITEH